MGPAPGHGVDPDEFSDGVVTLLVQNFFARITERIAENFDQILADLNEGEDELKADSEQDSDLESLVPELEDKDQIEESELSASEEKLKDEEIDTEEELIASEVV